MSNNFAVGHYHSWVVNEAHPTRLPASNRQKRTRPHHGFAPPQRSAARGSVSSGIGVDTGGETNFAELGSALTHLLYKEISFF
jgi:hypothetical protein